MTRAYRCDGCGEVVIAPRPAAEIDLNYEYRTLGDSQRLIFQDEGEAKTVVWPFEKTNAEFCPDCTGEIAEVVVSLLEGGDV